MKRRHVLLLFPFIIILLSNPAFVQCWGKTTKSEDPDSDHKVEVVTYGSIIKLEHVETQTRLHSHKISYGGGSGQQSVTCFSDTGDSNSFWVVKGAHGSPHFKQGVSVECGDTFRLQHLNTGKNLHSHLHKSPLSRDREVSAYAKSERDMWNDGDSGDNFEIICGEDEIGGGVWKRFAEIALRHVDTMNYVFASKSYVFQNPIPGQLQVSGASKNTKGSKWRTHEGIYFAPIEKH